MEKFPLKITSAVAIEGVIHKAGAVIDVAENVAKDLLRRGRAVVHSAAEAVERAADAVEKATEDTTAADDAPSTDAGTNADDAVPIAPARSRKK